MIRLHLADERGLDWAQRVVAEYHYLHSPVDPRCSPLAYLVRIEEPAVDRAIGCLIFGRPEATRCYDGLLTYGSLKDVQASRCQYDRWEVLNLARVYLLPAVQLGGQFYGPEWLPGYTDRRGDWRSTLASHVLGLALARVGYDYLSRRVPCFPDEPYEIRAVLSYCDTNLHKGTIYRAAGFRLARTNERGIETWCSTDVAPLTSYQHDQIRKLAGQSYRSRRQRARRADHAVQEVLL